ncbi:aldehyde dehydrogenase family protein, partial [Rhizobium ruizarguesonis]
MKLNDPSLFRQACPIADRWIEAEGRKAATVRNPATGEPLGVVPELGAAETEDAIRAAVIAQKLWAKKTAGERAAVLKSWHRLMIENRDDLAMILTLEQGKPLAEAKGEITYGASFIEWFAEEARRINGETIPGHQADKRILVLRQPAGVVAAITPWNFPNAMITRKIGPALAAGCGVVLKPALQTPFSAIAIAVLGERAGL